MASIGFVRTTRRTGAVTPIEMKSCRASTAWGPDGSPCCRFERPAHNSNSGMMRPGMRRPVASCTQCPRNVSAYIWRQSSRVSGLWVSRPSRVGRKSFCSKDSNAMMSRTTRRGSASVGTARSMVMTCRARFARRAFTDRTCAWPASRMIVMLGFSVDRQYRMTSASRESTRA